MHRRPFFTSQPMLPPRGLNAGLVSLALLACTSLASAQTHDLTRAEARHHFQQGVELAQGGSYQQALQEFLAAHRLTGNYAVLYNIGQSHMALGDSLAARAALEQYLTAGGAELDVERRTQVELQLTSLQSELAQLTIRSSAEGSALSIDGQASGTLPLLKPLWLTPGKHEIKLSSAEGSVLRALVLGRGEEQEVIMEPPAPLIPAPAPPLTPAVPRAEPAPLPTRSKPSPPPKLRTAGYVVGGVGLGLAAFTLGHFFWNMARHQEWKSENKSLEGDVGEEDYVARQTANNELAESIERASKVTVGLAATSGVLVASGVTLVVLSKRDSSKTSPEATGFLLSFHSVW